MWIHFTGVLCLHAWTRIPPAVVSGVMKPVLLSLSSSWTDLWGKQGYVSQLFEHRWESQYYSCGCYSGCLVWLTHGFQQRQNTREDELFLDCGVYLSSQPFSSQRANKSASPKIGCEPSWLRYPFHAADGLRCALAPLKEVRDENKMNYHAKEQLQ